MDRALYSREYRKKAIANNRCWQCGKAKINDKPRCEDCYEHNRILTRQRRREIKQEVINHYGGKCKCCGELNLFFLSIDHIMQNGAEHRRQLKSSGRQQTIYSWLKRNNYPEGFRVYCHNCNLGSYINGGICPHEQYKQLSATN